MRLSDLITGQEALIQGIEGSSDIKRRINELGLIEGQKVKAIKVAPLKDPVEYLIMGYKLTIRRKDAAMVIVEPSDSMVLTDTPLRYQVKFEEPPTYPPGELRKNGNGSSNKTIRIALVGNPNCGKTTIFNYATNSRERVGNYSGVTVTAKEGEFKVGPYKLIVVDLPGTYSLTPYSPEELYVTDYLMFSRPDVVINVVDAGNLERNLFLTSQLLETGLPTIIALNMYDEFTKSGSKLDYSTLGAMLGTPIVPTVGKRGKGVMDLFKMVVAVYGGTDNIVRSIRIPYVKEIEDSIILLSSHMSEKKEINDLPKRFLALKLLQGDRNMDLAFPRDNLIELKQLAASSRTKIEEVTAIDINSEVVNTKYGFINGALSETLTAKANQQTSDPFNPDRWLTHRTFGLPLFFGIIWFIFWCTFKLGQYPMGLIESGISWISGIMSSMLPESALGSLIIDGIIGGVGGILVFLPNIMILFFLISVLEDSGYMARTAFLMDKVMHKVGLHGKSFIPLLMGFGCNVPAIMATRTIESKRDRLVTMFITPFMSCSARLPVYVLFISAFFPHRQSIILFSIYLIGIFAALLTALILNRTIFRKSDSPFVMELPPYRVPTTKAIRVHTWFKTIHFIKKMGSVILIASIVVWALGYFPRDKEIISRYNAEIQEYRLNNNEYTDTLETMHPAKDSYVSGLMQKQKSELLDQSYISTIGRTFEPLFKPLGFDWRMTVSIITGMLAKELVVSTMAVLYQSDDSTVEVSSSLVSKLRKAGETNNTSLFTYFGFLVFTLLYFPCFGTLAAIKNETSGFKWVFFAAAYPLIFSWIVVFAINQVGNLF